MEKKKFSVRLVAGAAALCVTATFAGPSPAGAQSTAGVGTNNVTQSLLSLRLGDAAAPLLNLELLKDLGKTTIDSDREAPVGLSRLEPLSLASGVLPGLGGLTSILPVFESRTPGGQPSVTGSALNLGNPAGIAGLPVGLLGGSIIPNSLTSALDGEGARSGLDASLADVKLISGLLKIASVNNKSSTSAGLPQATGTRALGIDAVSLLNLGDLLQGLNLPLGALDLSVVSNLLSTLNLPVALPAGAPNLLAGVDGLLATITDLTGLVGADTAILDDVVSTVSSVSGLLGDLPTALPVSGTGLVPTDTLGLPTGTVEALLGTLQTTLANLLGNALTAVNDVSLLKLDGATIGASTKAAGTLAGSSADVSGALGGLSVLGLQLPGLDLLSVGDTLNAVTGRLSGVLGAISPLLKDLVKVGVLDKSTSLTTAGGYNNALAGINVLSVDIVPPALLSDLVGTLTGNGALSALGKLSAAGVASPAAGLPVLGGNALNLGGLLNLPATLGVLTKGLSLKLGSVQSASQFKLASAPAPAAIAAPVGDTLPRTGGDTRTLGMLAAGMTVLALGVRRWARRPEMD